MPSSEAKKESDRDRSHCTPSHVDSWRPPPRRSQRVHSRTPPERCRGKVLCRGPLCLRWLECWTISTGAPAGPRCVAVPPVGRSTDYPSQSPSQCDPPGPHWPSHRRIGFIFASPLRFTRVVPVASRKAGSQARHPLFVLVVHIRRLIPTFEWGFSRHHIRTTDVTTPVTDLVLWRIASIRHRSPPLAQAGAVPSRSGRDRPPSFYSESEPGRLPCSSAVSLSQPALTSSVLPSSSLLNNASATSLKNPIPITSPGLLRRVSGPAGPRPSWTTAQSRRPGAGA